MQTLFYTHANKNIIISLVEKHFSAADFSYNLKRHQGNFFQKFQIQISRSACFCCFAFWLLVVFY